MVGGFRVASPTIAIAMRGILLLPAYDAVRSLAHVGDDVDLAQRKVRIGKGETRRRVSHFLEPASELMELVARER